MAKVLFIVYVPSSKNHHEDSQISLTEKVNDDTSETKPEVDENNTKEETPVKDDTNPEVQEDGFQNESTTKEEKTESFTEVIKKEDEDEDKTADESQNNVFFKDVPKESSDASPSNAEVDLRPKDSEKENTPELDKEPEEKKPTFVRFLSEDLSLVEKVKRVLDDLNVKGVQWNVTEQNIFIGMFVASYGPHCEDILRKLSMLKIGVLKDSSVSIFPASISSEEKQMEEDIMQERIKQDELSEKVNRFKNSIKSRLVVDQVVNAVKNDALFTFDFLMLVILASFVALMGLLESSSVVLVASMLISPLMGPILAGVFGFVIHKNDLIRVGIVNEIRGLTICVFIGFIIGLIPAGLETGSTDWRSASEWPTPEMSSRGALRALPVGILIAIPSGAGVALSILGGKVGSLVGVAISASLLPPAVNAGLLWANAIVAAISPAAVHIASTNASKAEMSDIPSNGLLCPSLMNNDYERQYYCSMAKESVILGCVSLLLTILNIFCIILMGILVLKIKEVVPIPQSFIPESENEFFCQDLRIARESNITMKGQAAAAIKKEWLKTYQEMKVQAGKEGDAEEDDENELDKIIHEVQESPSVMNICDKMLIHPMKWAKTANIPCSHHEGGKFDFSTPYPSSGEDKENGMNLRQRAIRSSESYKTNEEDEESTSYFTVHSYIPPGDLWKRDSYLFKSGKFIKKLKLPQTSRFAVSKVAEEPEETIATSKAVGDVSFANLNETEAEPLLEQKPVMASVET